GEKDRYLIRRACVDFNIPLLTNLQAAIALASALNEYKLADLQIKSWDEYVKFDS
ncbi:hypothetical protein HY025_03385, partial [Candidatus Daviesbacteria bacterium]|nr:hypothetical protein [Candidatus Daviesbacteria bacterium]